MWRWGSLGCETTSPSTIPRITASDRHRTRPTDDAGGAGFGVLGQGHQLEAPTELHGPTTLRSRDLEVYAFTASTHSKSWQPEPPNNQQPAASLVFRGQRSSGRHPACCLGRSRRRGVDAKPTQAPNGPRFGENRPGGSAIPHHPQGPGVLAVRPCAATTGPTRRSPLRTAQMLAREARSSRAFPGTRQPARQSCARGGLACETAPGRVPEARSHNRTRSRRNVLQSSTAPC